MVAAFQFVYALCAGKLPLSGPGHGEEILHIIEELCEQSVGPFRQFLSEVVGFVCMVHSKKLWVEITVLISILANLNKFRSS